MDPYLFHKIKIQGTISHPIFSDVVIRRIAIALVATNVGLGSHLKKRLSKMGTKIARKSNTRQAILKQKP